MRQGRHNEHNQWFLVTNRLISEQSSGDFSSINTSAKAFPPQIKSPQNKFIANLYAENYNKRHSVYQRKRNSTVGEKESHVFLNR